MSLGDPRAILAEAERRSRDGAPPWAIFAQRVRTPREALAGLAAPALPDQFAELPGLWRRAGADGFAPDVRAATEVAARLVAASGSEARHV